MQTFLYFSADLLQIFRRYIPLTVSEYQLIKWDDEDASTHDPLRIRITNLTKHNPNQPNLNFTRDILFWAFNNCGISVGILMKFGMGVMP
jgi:hypothetical protein